MPEAPLLQRVMVQTVQGCNSRCIICPMGGRSDDGIRVMRPEIYNKILHECSFIDTLESFIPSLMSEPLLDPHLVERLEQARSVLPEVNLHLVSNGLLFSGDLAKWLINSPLDCIHLSINAWRPHSYERLTGRTDWAEVRQSLLQTVAVAVEARGESFVKVSVTPCLELIEEGEVDELETAVRGVGVQQVETHHRPDSRAGNVRGLSCIPLTEQHAVSGCTKLWTTNTLHVLHDGRVVPCSHDYQVQHVLGDVEFEPITRIWHGERCRAFRRRLAGEEGQDGLLCLSCELAAPAAADQVQQPSAEVAKTKVRLVPAPGARLAGEAANRAQWVDELVRAWLEQVAGYEVVPTESAADADLILVHLHPTADIRRLEIADPGPPVVGFGGFTAAAAGAQRLELNRLRLVLKGLPAPHWMPLLAAAKAQSRSAATEVVGPAFPDWQLIPAGAFRVVADRVLLRTALGSINRPAWSGTVAYEGPFRMRAVEAVCNELRELAAAGDLSSIDVVDEAVDLRCAGQLDRWLEILDRSRQQGWLLPLVAGSDHWCDDLRRLQDRGLCAVRWQLPSTLAAVCTALNAPATPEEVLEALRTAAEAGMRTELCLMVGAPGEDAAAPAATAEWLQQAAPALHRLVIETFSPESGSRLACDPGSLGIWWPPGASVEEWADRHGGNLTRRVRLANELAEVARELGVEEVSLGARTMPEVQRRRDRVVRRLIGGGLAPSADVVLTTTPPWGTDNPPVGLGYLAEAAAAAGHSCHVVDGNARLFAEVNGALRHLWHHENKNFWSRSDTFEHVERGMAGMLDAMADEIVAARPVLVGCSVVDPKELCTAALVRRIHQRDPHLPVVLGGPACLDGARRRILAELMGEQIVGFVCGEGEGPLDELVQRCSSGAALEGVTGFVPVADPELEVTPWRAVLEAVRFPRFEIFDSDLYGRTSMIVQWSRGCVGSCSFCKGHEVEGRFRHRSPADVVQELAWHSSRGVTDFTICDSELNGNVRFLRTTCNLIDDAGLDISWRGQAIPHRKTDDDLLQRMRRAGCVEIQYGLESGADEVLQAMGKGRMFRVAEAEQVIRNTHAAGIAVSLFLIIGFPGETEQHFAATLDFVRRNAGSIDSIKSVNALHVIEGTELHRNPEAFGVDLDLDAWHRDWRSRDGANTPEVRRERVVRTLQLARSLSIPVLEHNLEDDKADRAAKQLVGEHQSGPSFAQLIVVDGGDQPAADDQPRDPTSAAATEGGPIFAEIELAAACNLRCVGCWCHSPRLDGERHRELQQASPLSTDRILHLLEELAAMGAETVQLSGSGEPLMNRDAISIIGHAAQLGLSTNLITNGTLLSPELVPRLVDAGLDRLTVSLWAGDAETYLRTHPGQSAEAFEQLTHNLHLVARSRSSSGRPAIKLFHVISHLNAGTIPAMVDHALAVDADEVELQVVDLLPETEVELGLTADDRQVIEESLQALTRRTDYSSNWVGEPCLRHGTPEMVADEFRSFGRFLRPQQRPVVVRPGPSLRCHKGFESRTGEPNTTPECNFVMPPDACQSCELRRQCYGDGSGHSIVLPTLELVGAGTFRRRLLGLETGQQLMEREVLLEIPCVVGRLYSRIDYRGNVLGCCKGSAFPLGNVADSSFALVWGSARYQTFRDNAYALAKDHPYFKTINCLAGCDNIGMSLQAQYFEAP